MASKSRNTFLVLLLLMAGSRGVHAQFRLPPFDVEFKVTQALIPNDYNNSAAINLDVLEATSIHGAAHIQLGQHIGIGWLYSRSFRGSVNYSTNGGTQSAPGSEDAYLLTSGPDVRISSGRGKKTRFYLGLNYTNVEFIDDKGGYRLAHKTNALGASIGLMRRLSNTVYINIIELGARALVGEKAFWLNSDIMLEAKTGVTINFSKRK